jgi:hypothetical protein
MLGRYSLVSRLPRSLNKSEAQITLPYTVKVARLHKRLGKIPILVQSSLISVFRDVYGLKITVKNCLALS